jgi:hypothetical protein
MAWFCSMFSPKRFEMTRIVCHRARVKFVAVFMIAATGFLTRGVSGYSLEGPKWSRNPVMQMNLGPAGRTLSDGRRSWNGAAAPALGMWNQVMKRIQLGSVVVRPTVRPARRDGRNSMAFSKTVFGQAWGANTLAVTIIWASGSTITEADVLFNDARTWDSYRGPLRFGGVDIQRVALHELGHVIGLDHPDEAGQDVDAIMNSVIDYRYTLSGDDITGAQYLYATPSKKNILLQNSSTRERVMFAPGPKSFGGDHPNGIVLWYWDYLGTVSTQWNIVASAVNGNGSVDIVWQNSSTGECSVWFMRDATHVSNSALPTLLPFWEIATAADFNGDGKPDLLLQNMATGQRVIWFMNGTTHTSSWSLGVVPTMWKITGSGDFNGNGKADILWQNNITGQRMIWFMNGAIHIGSWSLGTVPTVWNMVGTVDFNDDGKPDIVWQNQTTGQGVIWLMNGPRRIGSFSAPSLSLGSPTEWSIRNY